MWLQYSSIVEILVILAFLNSSEGRTIELDFEGNNESKDELIQDIEKRNSHLLYAFNESCLHEAAKSCVSYSTYLYLVDSCVTNFLFERTETCSDFQMDATPSPDPREPCEIGSTSEASQEPTPSSDPSTPRNIESLVPQIVLKTSDDTSSIYSSNPTLIILSKANPGITSNSGSLPVVSSGQAVVAPSNNQIPNSQPISNPVLPPVSTAPIQNNPVASNYPVPAPQAVSSVQQGQIVYPPNQIVANSQPVSIQNIPVPSNARDAAPPAVQPRFLPNNPNPNPQPVLAQNIPAPLNNQITAPQANQPALVQNNPNPNPIPQAVLTTVGPTTAQFLLTTPNPIGNIPVQTIPVTVTNPVPPTVPQLASTVPVLSVTPIANQSPVTQPSSMPVSSITQLPSTLPVSTVTQNPMTTIIVTTARPNSPMPTVQIVTTSQPAGQIVTTPSSQGPFPSPPPIPVQG